MKLVTIKNDGSSKTPSLIWNVDMPVGNWKANREDDVRLVQVLLSNIYASALAAPRTGEWDAPGLEVNGRCTEATIFWIKRFQFDHIGRLYADGVVDPVPSTGNSVSTISQTTYCIVVMNEKFNGPLVTVPTLIRASQTETPLPPPFKDPPPLVFRRF